MYMDAVFYNYIPPGTKVLFIRSSIEQPFIWTMFEGYVAKAFDINKRYYYQCTLSNIIANEDWIDKYVANKTYRLTACEDGHQENVLLWHEYKDGQSFIDAWKQWWHTKWWFDLTADLVFDDTNKNAKCKVLQTLSTIYLTNSNTFANIDKICQEQLNLLKQI